MSGDESAEQFQTFRHRHDDGRENKMVNAFLDATPKRGKRNRVSRVAIFFHYIVAS